MRESHPLAPEESGFTDRRVYFSTVIPDIKAAIYIARAASPKPVSYFRFYLLYCAQMTKPHIADTHISLDAEVERRW